MNSQTADQITERSNFYIDKKKKTTNYESRNDFVDTRSEVPLIYANYVIHEPRIFKNYCARISCGQLDEKFYKEKAASESERETISIPVYRYKNIKLRC